MRISWKTRAMAAALPAALIVVSLRTGPQAGAHQPRDRAARAGPADLLHRLARRDRGQLRAGREGRPDLGGLHQLRHGARAVRRQRAGRVHAGARQGRPDKSGHRTPAVIVNVPVNGTDEATVRANAWMFQQVLATGVHGILLCHADEPGAARAFVEAVRFPAHGGRRGVHGNSTARAIWGISRRRLRRAGRRLAAQPERRAAARPEARRQVRARERRRQREGAGRSASPSGDPATWRSRSACTNGPGPLPPALQAARAKVFAATKESKIFFLNTVTADNVIDMIKEGVMIGAANEQAAEVGRKLHAARDAVVAHGRAREPAGEPGRPFGVKILRYHQWKEAGVSSGVAEAQVRRAGARGPDAVFGRASLPRV